MSLMKLLWKETTPKEPMKESPKSLSTQSIPAQTAIPSVPMGIQMNTLPSDSEFMNYLKGIMDKSNLPGPDYYEFVQALDSMKTQPLSEQQKFIAIFAGFQAQGVTTNLLIDSAQKYISILTDSKAKEFDVAVEGVNQQIASKNAQIQQLTLKNEELNKTIQQNADTIAGLNKEVIEMSTKISTKKSLFEGSFNNFIGVINENISKIKTYLNGHDTK